jgi:hypothetical protein
MSLFTVQKIARNPTAFLRMVVPLQSEIPGIRYGDYYNVFEILTAAEYLVELQVYGQMEIIVIQAFLEEAGFKCFEPDLEVRLLVQDIEFHLRAQELFSEKCTFLERLRAMEHVLGNERRPAARQLRREVRHLLASHSPMQFGNQPTPRRFV